MGSVYTCWFFIYLFEFYHVYNIIAMQKLRKEDIKNETERTIREVVKNLGDEYSTDNPCLELEPGKEQVLHFNLEGGAGGGKDGKDLHKPIGKVALPINKKSNADVLKRFNSTPIAHPEQILFSPPKRGSVETVGAEEGDSSPKGREILADARLGHRALSDGIEINVRHDYVQKQHTERDRRRRSLSLGSDGPDFIVRSWHPIYRVLIVLFCLIEGVAVILAHHEGFSEDTGDSVLLVVWAMWPLCGLLVSSIFLSDLREEVKFPKCELFCFLVGGYFPWMYSGAFGFTRAFEGTLTAILVQTGSVMIGVCLLYFLWEIRRQMRNMDEDEVSQ